MSVIHLPSPSMMRQASRLLLLAVPPGRAVLALAAAALGAPVTLIRFLIARLVWAATRGLS